MLLRDPRFIEHLLWALNKICTLPKGTLVAFVMKPDGTFAITDEGRARLNWIQVAPLPKVTEAAKVAGQGKTVSWQSSDALLDNALRCTRATSVRGDERSAEKDRATHDLGRAGVDLVRKGVPLGASEAQKLTLVALALAYPDTPPRTGSCRAVRTRRRSSPKEHEICDRHSVTFFAAPRTKGGPCAARVEASPHDGILAAALAELRREERRNGVKPSWTLKKVQAAFYRSRRVATSGRATNGG
jgi:hypothetical protein